MERYKEEVKGGEGRREEGHRKVEKGGDGRGGKKGGRGTIGRVRR